MIGIFVTCLLCLNHSTNRFSDGTMFANYLLRSIHTLSIKQFTVWASKEWWRNSSDIKTYEFSCIEMLFQIFFSLLNEWSIISADLISIFHFSEESTIFDEYLDEHLSEVNQVGLNEQFAIAAMKYHYIETFFIQSKLFHDLHKCWFNCSIRGSHLYAFWDIIYVFIYRMNKDQLCLLFWRYKMVSRVWLSARVNLKLRLLSAILRNNKIDKLNRQICGRRAFDKQE